MGHQDPSTEDDKNDGVNQKGEKLDQYVSSHLLKSAVILLVLKNDSAVDYEGCNDRKGVRNDIADQKRINKDVANVKQGEMKPGDQERVKGVFNCIWVSQVGVFNP